MKVYAIQIFPSARLIGMGFGQVLSSDNVGSKF